MVAGRPPSRFAHRSLEFEEGESMYSEDQYMPAPGGHEGDPPPEGAFDKHQQQQGFTPMLQAPPFRFATHRVRLDWRLLHGMDVERVVRDVDIDALESVVDTIATGDIEAEDTRNFTETNFVKLFRVAQLIVEYLMHIQDTLATHKEQLKVAAYESKRRAELLRSKCREQKEGLGAARRELRRCKKSLQMYEILLRLRGHTPGDEVHTCHVCHKVFQSEHYLDLHYKRRHPGTAPAPLRGPAAAGAEDPSHTAQPAVDVMALQSAMLAAQRDALEAREARAAADREVAILREQVKAQDAAREDVRVAMDRVKNSEQVTAQATIESVKSSEREAARREVERAVAASKSELDAAKKALESRDARVETLERELKEAQRWLEEAQAGESAAKEALQRERDSQRMPSPKVIRVGGKSEEEEDDDDKDEMARSLAASESRVNALQKEVDALQKELDASRAKASKLEADRRALQERLDASATSAAAAEAAARERVKEKVEEIEKMRKMNDEQRAKYQEDLDATRQSADLSHAVYTKQREAEAAREAAQAAARQAEDVASGRSSAPAPAPVPKVSTADLRGIFSSVDKNNDGSITRRELLVGMKHDPKVAALLRLPNKIHQEGYSRAQFESVFHSLDTSQDDKVSLSEFLAYFDSPPAATPEFGIRAEAEAAAGDAGGGGGDGDGDFGIVREAKGAGGVRAATPPASPPGPSPKPAFGIEAGGEGGGSAGDRAAKHEAAAAFLKVEEEVEEGEVVSAVTPEVLAAEAAEAEAARAASEAAAADAAAAEAEEAEAAAARGAAEEAALAAEADAAANAPVSLHPSEAAQWRAEHPHAPMADRPFAVAKYRHDAELVREWRPDVEVILEDKLARALEEYGIDPEADGLSDRDYAAAMDKLERRREEMLRAAGPAERERMEADRRAVAYHLQGAGAAFSRGDAATPPGQAFGTPRSPQSTPRWDSDEGPTPLGQPGPTQATAPTAVTSPPPRLSASMAPPPSEPSDVEEDIDEEVAGGVGGGGEDPRLRVSAAPTDYTERTDYTAATTTSASGYERSSFEVMSSVDSGASALFRAGGGGAAGGVGDSGAWTNPDTPPRAGRRAGGWAGATASVESLADSLNESGGTAAGWGTPARQQRLEPMAGAAVPEQAALVSPAKGDGEDAIEAFEVSSTDEEKSPVRTGARRPGGGLPPAGARGVGASTTSAGGVLASPGGVSDISDVEELGM